MNSTICCPYCGCVGYHMWAGTGACPGVRADQDKDLLARVADALESLHPYCKKTGDIIAELRRSAVRIDFRGECGDWWSLILQQHKGMMEFYARVMEPPPREREEWEENHPIEQHLAKAQKIHT